MRLHFILILFCAIPFASKAQVEPTELDTIATHGLREFVYFSDMRKYEFLKRKTIKMYPYVMHAIATLEELDSTIVNLDKKRYQKKKVKEINSDLNEDFKYVVMDMTQSEGEILVKLLHRYTSKTAFQIIAEYQGLAKAVTWQTISLTGGANLKLKHDPEEDKMLEHIVRQIEAGYIKVPDAPYIITKAMHKEEKAKDKARAKKRKQEKKAAKKRAKSNEPVKESSKPPFSWMIENVKP
jgi:hypothetical protein